MAKWSVTIFLDDPTIETARDLGEFVAETFPLDLERQYVTDWQRLPDDADPAQTCIEDPDDENRGTVEDQDDEP